MRPAMSVSRRFSRIGAGECADDQVARGVSVAIVHALEVIDVEHQKRRRMVVALRVTDGVFAELVERAAVVERRQKVSASEDLDAIAFEAELVCEAVRLKMMGSADWMNTNRTRSARISSAMSATPGVQRRSAGVLAGCPGGVPPPFRVGP